jgi:hypothetical protein
MDLSFVEAEKCLAAGGGEEGKSKGKGQKAKIKNR